MYISYIGKLFLRMLKALILPLIIPSLVAAVGSLDMSLSGKVSFNSLQSDPLNGSNKQIDEPLTRQIVLSKHYKIGLANTRTINRIEQVSGSDCNSESKVVV